MTTQEVIEKTSRGVKAEPTAERKYKDRMFRMIFNDKKELLSLYNAVSGKHYTNPEEGVSNKLCNSCRLFDIALF